MIRLNGNVVPGPVLGFPLPWSDFSACAKPPLPVRKLPGAAGRADGRRIPQTLAHAGTAAANASGHEAPDRCRTRAPPWVAAVREPRTSSLMRTETERPGTCAIRMSQRLTATRGSSCPSWGFPSPATTSCVPHGKDGTLSPPPVESHVRQDPLSRGTAPVQSALCPGAVSVAACAKRSSRT